MMVVGMSGAILRLPPLQLLLYEEANNIFTSSPSDRGPSLQGSVRREFPGHLLPSSTTTGGVGPDNA